MEHTFSIEQYKVHLFLNDIDTQNMVIEMAFEEHGADVKTQCQALGAEPFHYAVITGLDWENDLSPWPAEGLLSKNDSFGGKADAFLQTLVQDIMPRIKTLVDEYRSTKTSNVNASERYRYILVGYSLAGLTALYSAYQYDYFDAVASVSGALWYPNFLEFVQNHKLQNSVKAVYVSLGDKECKTRNPYMSQVQDRTEAIHTLLDAQGMNTVFELNPGNHFTDEVLRIAKGIRWGLSQSV